MDDKKQKMAEILTRAEQELAQDPQAYKKKLLHYSFLGYGVILLLVAVLATLVGGTVLMALSSSLFLLLLFKKKLIIPLLIMVWVLLKSVFIRFPKPQGIELTKDNAPELVALVEELRSQLDCGKIHQILLTPDLNAAVMQTPRFLAFGFTHNTLVIGFELLLSLSEQEVKSVIAHELGHLSGNHSKFNGWIYRSRESWRNMMLNLDQHNSWTTAPIRKFFNWYSPLFSAYSFALARLNEYEADQVAASHSSQETAASALLKLPVYSDFILEHYWNQYNAQILKTPAPEVLPYIGLVHFLENYQVNPLEAKASIDLAKRATTNHHDTHPSLADRLDALDSNSYKFQATDISAARSFFGDELIQLAKHLDDAWHSFNAEGWKQEFELAQQEQQELQAISALPEAQLTQEQLWQLAWLGEKFQPEQDPLPAYLRYHQQYPKDEKGTYSVGRILLQTKDASGLDYLEQVLRKDEYIEAASHLAYQFLLEQGDTEQANQWLEKAWQLEEICYAAQQERTQISSGDRLTKPELDLQEYQPLLDNISQHKRVKGLWLAQKQVQHFTDSPVLILAVKAKAGFYISDSLADDLLDMIPEELLQHTRFFIVTKSSNRKIFKLIQAIGLQLKGH